MTKRLIISLVSFAIIIVLSIVFILVRTRNRMPGEPLKAIPLNAGLIFRVNDFRKLTDDMNDNPVWQELANTGVFERLNSQLEFLDSLISRNQDVRSLLHGNPWYISGHVTGNGKSSFLHVIKTPKTFSEKRVAEMIKSLVINLGTVSTRKYEGYTITDVRFLDQKKLGNFSYSTGNGLFILSFSSILVEDAIRQYLTGSPLTADRYFSKVYNTAGKNVPASVFINYAHVTNLLTPLVKPDYRPQIRGYNNFAAWAELDLNMNSEALLLNGFTAISDSALQLFTIFRNQSPKRITVDNILPSTVSSYIMLSLSNTQEYLKNFNSVLQNNGKYNEYQKNVALLKSRYNMDISQSFYDLLDGEMAVAMKTPNHVNEKPDILVVFTIKSHSHTEKKLVEALAGIARNKSVSAENYRYACKIDNELTYWIYKWPVDDFLRQFMGDFFKGLDQHYFTLIDNYLVFGNSTGSLSDLIHDNVLSKTLITDIAYREYKNNLSPRTTLSFYADLSKAPMDFSRFLRSDILKAWEHNIGVFQKVQVFGLQLSSGSNLMYTNIFCKTLTEYKDEPHTVWESLLDTAVNCKPQFVVNHNTKQTEIFLQDMRNTIYLINQAGRILWKENIGERINSAVYQVDYYKNGKLQILFSTRNYLHLIDRNGNYVERYPVKLRSPATCGVSLVDYENNKNYRLFIPGEDRKVYAYTVEGTIVNGWNFGKSEDLITQPLNHFRIGDKDYIVFGDRLKTYILNRRGETRVSVEELIPKSKNNNYYLDTSSDPKKNRIVTTDTSGQVCFIYFNGHVAKTGIKKFSEDHFFDLKDIDGDGQNDFIFLDRNALMVFNASIKKLFEYDFEATIDLPPAYYHFSASDRKIGVVSGKEKRIYLINNNGLLYKGFPLTGTTLFSIGYLGSTVSHFNLIVGGENNFLYNYIVQ